MGLKDRYIRPGFFSGLRKTISDVIGGQVSQSQLLGMRAFDTDFQEKAALDQYKQWVATAADMNANAVAKANLRVFAARGPGEMGAGLKYGKAVGRPIDNATARHLKSLKSIQSMPVVKQAHEIEEIVDHPLVTLLSRVNDHMSQFELMHLSSLHVDITGDAYWHMIPSIGPPEQVWPLPPQLVRVVPDPTKFIKHYLFGKDRSQPKIMLPGEIVHFMRPNPKTPWNGSSRVQKHWIAIKGFDSMEIYEASLTDNMAIPPSILNWKKGTLNSKKRRELFNEFKRAVGGLGGAGNVFITDENMELKEMSFSPREISFLNGRVVRKEEIVNGFGQTLGLYDKDTNRANIQGAIYLWETYETNPTLRLFEQKLNEQLVPRYDEPRLFVAFDPVQTNDAEQELKEDEFLVSSGVPINIVLASRGKPAVEGGDVGFIDANRVPLVGATGSAHLEEDSVRGRDKTLQKSPTAQLKRPSTGGSHDLWIKDGSSWVTGCGCKDQNGVEHMIIRIKQNGDVEDIELTGGPNPGLNTDEKTIAAAVRETLDDQLPLALEEAPRGEGADFAFLTSEEWVAALTVATLATATTQAAKGAVVGQSQSGIVIADFLDRPNVVQAIRNQNLDFARKFGETSEAQLREQLLIGTRLNENPGQLTKRVQGVFDGWEKWRAERAARSETARAFMLGKEAQWAETGVVIAKVWDANADACPFCLSQNGRVVELGRPFWQLGEKLTVDFKGRDINLNFDYLPVASPPLHPSCRCDIKPKLIELN